MKFAAINHLGVVAVTNPRLADSDGDGLTDGQEVYATTATGDVWDSNATMDIEVRAWAEYALTDVELDICGGQSKSISFQYQIKTNRWQDAWGTACVWGNGTGDGYDNDRDANLTLQVQTVLREKAHTVVVNSTDYGIYEVEDGGRYTADDQLHLFYLNCSSSSTHFVQGLNVVLLPRSIALESKVNDTLMDLEHITESSPLYQASFFATNDSASLSSNHIIAVISKNMTGAKAEELLDMMTHNATDARIGNDVTVSTEQQYLMHLPRDVLAYIPLLSVTNSPVGDLPADFWGHLWNTIVSVADFIWRGLVAVASFMISLVVALVDIGVKWFQFVANVVEQVVDAIVDAFMAFVQWATEFIKLIVGTFLSPLIQSIEDLAGRYYRGIASAVVAGVNDFLIDGELSLSTFAKFSAAWFDDFYWILFAIASLVTILFVILLPVTSIFGFLLAFAGSCILGYVASTAFGLAESYLAGAESEAYEHSNAITGDQPESIMSSAASLAHSEMEGQDSDQMEILLKVVGALVIGMGAAAGILWSIGNVESKLVPVFKAIVALGLSSWAFVEEGESRKCLTLVSLPVSLAALVHTWQAIQWDGGYGSIARVLSLVAFGITVWGVADAFT